MLGRKLGMSQIFQDDGTVTPVTLIEAGPVTVTQVKINDRDGYEAVQIGFERAKRAGKSLKGHLKGLPGLKNLKEFRTPVGELKRGDTWDVLAFKAGDLVKVSGVSKAKGFQGVVKRHGFHGMPASHGHHHVLRHGGSIGQRFPQHTLKGMRMAGRTGGQRNTIRGLKVISVDKDNNLLAVKGAVPGRRGTILEIVNLSSKQ